MADWDLCKLVDPSGTSTGLDEGLESLHRWGPEDLFFFRDRSVKLQSCCRLSNLLRGTLKHLTNTCTFIICKKKLHKFFKPMQIGTIIIVILPK